MTTRTPTSFLKNGSSAFLMTSESLKNALSMFFTQFRERKSLQLLLKLLRRENDGFAG
jgi:hypothetical protein